MSELLAHENLRVRAYARATGADRIDYRYARWIEALLAEAADKGGAGAFRFEPDGRPHIHDHDAFTAFCVRRAYETAG